MKLSKVIRLGEQLIIQSKIKMRGNTMADVCIKENVREMVSTRNGKREEVTGRLFACLDEDNTILIGYAKLHRDLDCPKKDFRDYVVKERAFTLKTRLADVKVVREHGQIILVSEDTLGSVIKERRLPFVISDALPGFLVRAKKYFQQGTLVSWAAEILAAMPTA